MKIHATTDALRNPTGCHLTGGEASAWVQSNCSTVAATAYTTTGTTTSTATNGAAAGGNASGGGGQLQLYDCAK